MTNTGPVTYTVNYVYADSVTLSNADVTLIRTGTANGTVAVSGTGTSTRTVTISGITGDGTLGISIAADSASNFGDFALAAGPSATFTVDNTAPTLSIGASSGSVTKGGPVTYTVTYTGADAVTLANGNVTLNKTGAANGTVAISGTGTNTRTVTISGITGDGTLGISIAASTANDNAGNTAASAGPSATFAVDNTPPSLAQVAAVPTPSSNHNPIYTFSSTEVGNITYGGSCRSATTTANVGSNSITLRATNGDPLPEGSYSNCTIIATDAAGNPSELLAINHFIIQGCAYQPALIWGRFIYEATMQDAYDTAVNGETVALHTTDFNEDLLVDQDKHIMLTGGFNCDYSVNAGYSTLMGTTIISGGTLEIENLVITSPPAP
ncbi:MAG: hypothetical protein WA610_08255 [Thermodesulfovibrionales bacterium]